VSPLRGGGEQRGLPSRRTSGVTYPPLPRWGVSNMGEDGPKRGVPGDRSGSESVDGSRTMGTGDDERADEGAPLPPPAPPPPRRRGELRLAGDDDDMGGRCGVVAS
jgi:hypothetical protein